MKAGARDSKPEARREKPEREKPEREKQAELQIRSLMSEVRREKTEAKA